MPRSRRLPALHVLRSIDRTIPHDPDVPPMTSEELAQRPRTRADCADALRPCPWYSCKHHLALDVDPNTGRIDLRADPEHLAELRDTCALDVADRGGVTLEVVGELLGVTRERVRQLEDKALARLARRGGDQLLEHLTD